MDVSTILVAVDGSPSARKALDFAADLARVKQARMLLVHAFRSQGRDRVPPELESYAKIEKLSITEHDLYAEAAERITQDAQRSVRALGISEVEAITVEGDPTRVIIDAARSHEADMIVLGSRGIGDLEGLLLGSVSHKVAHLAPCTCVIIR